MGYSKEKAEEYSRVGIIAEDHYLLLVRDAVTFPGGIPGVYDRLVWRSGLSGPPGVVIFPVTENKKILVNINFRHSTRSWEAELPRGARHAKEAPEKTAARELKEETGCICSKYTLLGELIPDSGILGGTTPVYMAQIKQRKARHQDESEAIASNIEMSIEELQEAYIKGFIILDVHGEKTKVYCRDPFLTYALMQAIWRKLI